MSQRRASRVVATVAIALVGVVLLSGTDQPVTAHPYPRWQQVIAPPFSARTHPLAAKVGRRVDVLGGLRPDGSVLRDGAAYDVRTGRWHRLVAPVALTDRDPAVAAAGVLVVDADGSWWRYDARPDRWTHLRGVPPGLRAPTSFGSEVYALSRRRVAVYSPQLGRWSLLPADRLAPLLQPTSVSASRRGTVVTGRVDGDVGSDRWDGVRWRRLTAAPPASRRAPADALVTRVRIDGRVLVVRGDRAWIRLP